MLESGWKGVDGRWGVECLREEWCCGLEERLEREN